MVISIARDGQEIGEWTEDQVRALYRDGQLLGTDQYWHEGLAEWRPLRQLVKPALPDIAGGGEPAAPATPMEPRADIARGPATALEEAMAKLGPFPEGWLPSTFQRRAMARVVDYLVLTACSEALLFLVLLPVVLLMPSRIVFLCVTVVVGYAIFNLMFFVWDWAWVSLTGASPGKWLFGLRVVRSDGTAGISMREAASRSQGLLRALWYLFGFPYLTGLLVPGIDKRFLHTGTTTWDAKAGTVVIGKRIGTVRLAVGVILSVLSILGIALCCSNFLWPR